MTGIRDRIRKLKNSLVIAGVLGGAPMMNAAEPESSASSDPVQNSVENMVSVNVDNSSVPIKELDTSQLVFSAELLNDVQPGDMGKQLATQARKAQRKVNDDCHCYRAVKLAVRSAGLGNLTGVSAWEAAEQLRDNDNFIEIECPNEDLDKLPDGTIVVYGKGKTKGTQHGHIGVIVEEKDISSKVRNVNTRGMRGREAYGDISVFVPCDTIVSNQNVIRLSENNAVHFDEALKYLLDEQSNKR